MLQIQQAKLWKKLYFHWFPSDPNIRKKWMNFIFNEDPDHVIKNLVLCSFYRRLIYKQGTIWYIYINQSFLKSGKCRWGPEVGAENSLIWDMQMKVP